MGQNPRENKPTEPEELRDHASVGGGNGLSARERLGWYQKERIILFTYSGSNFNRNFAKLSNRISRSRRSFPYKAAVVATSSRAHHRLLLICLLSNLSEQSVCFVWLAQQFNRALGDSAWSETRLSSQDARSIVSIYCIAKYPLVCAPFQQTCQRAKTSHGLNLFTTLSASRPKTWLGYQGYLRWPPRPHHSIAQSSHKPFLFLWQIPRTIQQEQTAHLPTLRHPVPTPSQNPPPLADL